MTSPLAQPPHTPSRPIPIERPTVDTSRAHPARRYDYWLGGKDHFVADRESGDAIAEAFPTVRTAAIENRRFLLRAVTWLAAEAGIRQFLDIGSGIPTSPAVHELAQRIAPAARVVYVDADPMVIAHGRARTTSSPQGTVTHLQADLRHPHTILTNPLLSATLDLTQPVAVLLSAVLHFIPDHHQPARIITRLSNALAPGSYFAVSHATLDPLSPNTAHRITTLFAADSAHGVFQPRSRDEIAALLGGLPLVAPGLVPIIQWRPDQPPQPQASTADTAMYGALARVP